MDIYTASEVAYKNGSNKAKREIIKMIFATFEPDEQRAVLKDLIAKELKEGPEND